jgi:glyoxylase-like metal-dependent hydrolase (beta-lactamase superfamily II)
VEFRADPVGPFPASYPLTEAGDVLLVPTPGHTHGHLSVIVDQPGQPRLVLAGDASYRQDLMLEGRSTASPPTSARPSRLSAG